MDVDCGKAKGPADGGKFNNDVGRVLRKAVSLVWHDGANPNDSRGKQRSRRKDSIPDGRYLMVKKLVLCILLTPEHVPTRS